MKLRSAGFTLVELVIFLSALLIPTLFLVYYSPGIVVRVQEYWVEKKLRQISLGLHIYASQDSSLSFPTGSSAEDAFRKIFVQGSILDPDVFDDPRLPNGKPVGTPGAALLSPSKDLTGVDYLYAREPLSLKSDPNQIIVLTKDSSASSRVYVLALHLDGSVTRQKKTIFGNFA